VIFIRSPYNYDGDLVSMDTAVSEFGESPTQQHHKDACNINRIVKQFAEQGVPPIGNAHQALPEGFYAPQTFQEAMTIVRRGEEAFQGLSARLRAKFNNNPAEFVDFATNPANLNELRELGLAPVASATTSPVTPPKGAPEGGGTVGPT